MVWAVGVVEVKPNEKWVGAILIQPLEQAVHSLVTTPLQQEEIFPPGGVERHLVVIKVEAAIQSPHRVENK